MTEGIFDGAIWLPGPTWKVGYTVFGRTSQKRGVVDHSADGPLQATLGVLNGPRTASWQFTNDDDLYQHYSINDVCWHAGYEANRVCVGVENTGKGPLTERQYNNLLRLHRWLKVQGVLTVCERRIDLWEHNEWMATDCPSGRIPWERLIADLREEDMKLYRMKDRPEVYFAAGGKLVHIPNRSVFIALGYKDEDVEVLPAGSPIWGLPVEYPSGVPADLR